MAIPGTLPPSGANFRMIDVGEKIDTRRRALASGRFFASPDTVRKIVEKQIPKGDVLALAEIAGIQGAKSTASLLPLCHPLPLHSVRVWSEPSEDSILVFCEVITTGKTGVEMEALTGVSLALLCIYDLTKVIDPVLCIGDVHLDMKEGGKSGVWKNPKIAERKLSLPTTNPGETLKDVKVCLLTVSDRCSLGEADDISGANLRSWCAERGATILETAIVPDQVDTIVKTLEGWLEREKPDLVVTSGGTGVSPRDLTPEAYQLLTTRLQGKEIPGIGELLRKNGSHHTCMAWLSRSLGLQVKGTTFIALPGNPKAVVEGLEALAPLFSHLFHIQHGGDHVGKHKLR